ncbi:hypothetical protein [Sulfurimonas sp.]|uniref:hypothetical protein n=1 Tax=Sulfurimonas sp. TaxID=2022749 RepID=UPI003568CB51
MCQSSFSLHSGSFDKGSNNKETIYSNIEKLRNVNDKIKSFDDLLFKEEDIFIANFIDDKQLFEILFLEHASFSQDYKTILIDIVQNSKNQTGEDYPKVGLNHIAEDIIYTVEDLMQYYYKCMEETHNEEEFSVCIERYFNNLKFQNKIDDTLKTLEGGGLKYFSRDIIKSLVCLENEFKTILNDNHQDVRKSLVKYSSMIGLSTTIEGNADRKPDFTFGFKKDDKSAISVCCEPHVKLCNSSKSSDSTYYYNRLHFHVGQEGVEEGKILIGSIGYHR